MRGVLNASLCTCGVLEVWCNISTYPTAVAGCVTLARELTPGLLLRRITCPIGVLCIIFEARPEAIIQITSLALKSGNAVILKGGKEANYSNTILVTLIRDALAAAATCGSSVPLDAVQLVSSREDVAELLRLDHDIDVSFPARAATTRPTLTSMRCLVIAHCIFHVRRSSLFHEVLISLYATSRRRRVFRCSATPTVCAQCISTQLQTSTLQLL